MTAGAKLAAFALVLAGALGVGAAVGSAVGPIDTTPERHEPTHSEPSHTDPTHVEPHLHTHGW